MTRPQILGVGTAALLLMLAGCSAPAPAPSTPAAVESPAAESAPEEAETEEPVEGPDMAAIVAELQAVSPAVTAVTETEPGRWEIATSIVDPRGADTSAEAQAAITICQKAVELGAAKVSVMESDGSTYALYGHPAYGDVCTVV